MATSKPSSTISYNTLPFLKARLKELYDSHLIQAYMFIQHKGEDGDKDHIHLRIEPNKRLDLMEIQHFFNEPDINNPDKPLGCRPFRPSKEEDWFLYAVHDKKYMQLKYKDDPREKLPYKDEDIVISPGYDLDIAMIRARASLAHHATNILSELESGFSAPALVKRGENPVLVRTIQMIMVNENKDKALRKAQEDFALEAKKRFQLEKFLTEHGFSICFNKEGDLTIEKNYDNVKEKKHEK